MSKIPINGRVLAYMVAAGIERGDSWAKIVEDSELPFDVLYAASVAYDPYTREEAIASVSAVLKANKGLIL